MAVQGRCGGKGGEGWFKGAVNPRTDGLGYQGVCWRCGKVGHKTAECTVRLQEVTGETGAEERQSRARTQGLRQRFWRTGPRQSGHGSNS